MHVHPTAIAALHAGCAALALTFAFLIPAEVAAQSRKAPPQATGSVPEPKLVRVASFPKHQVTGVTVAKDGRIFVNFPRWEEDVPVSVAEVMPDGSMRPYPDATWNAWRNAKENELAAADHFVCVQSVVMDSQGFLWVLDPAAPATQFIVKGGPSW